MSAPAAPGAPAQGTADDATASARAWTKAYAQGQWSAAVELLETIPESSRTAWHWLHLARALERQAQLVEAFAAYERVHDLAVGGAGVAGMREVERQAALESSALSSRIPWAEVSLAPSLPAGALVFIDQQWLEPTRLRSPYPVNPGWHTFLLEADGEVLAARRAFFEEGQTRPVPLMGHDSTLGMVPANVHAKASPPSPVTASPVPASPVTARPMTAGRIAASPSIPTPAAPSDIRPNPAHASPLAWRPGARHASDADHGPGSLLEASYVTLGVGAVGTLVGTGFLISTLNMRTGVGELSQDDADRARRRWRAHATAATAGYAIGLTGLVMGSVLLLLHRDSMRATTVNIADLSLELAPHFSPHGATLRGTF